jgi:hypothetical protein
MLKCNCTYHILPPAAVSVVEGERNDKYNDNVVILLRSQSENLIIRSL